MPNRVQWDPRFSVGDETLDAQHKHFLEQCNALADCLDEPGDEGNRKFTQLFAELLASARAHFAAEEKLLANHGYPDLDDHRSEQEEFEHLAAEILTADNFDPVELQTFLALWWTGHTLDSTRKLRPFLERQTAT